MSELASAPSGEHKRRADSEESAAIFASITGDTRRTTTIAYLLHTQAVRPAELPEVQKEFTQVFDRSIPGIERKLHNIVLITSHKGRMLMFNFNSTKSGIIWTP